jgi:hypothetical protein
MSSNNDICSICERVLVRYIIVIQSLSCTRFVRQRNIDHQMIDIRWMLFFSTHLLIDKSNNTHDDDLFRLG